MITLLSPAKTLDYAPAEVLDYSLPRFQDKTQALVSTLRRKSSKGLRELMNISDDLATLNAERYANFSPNFDLENSKQAVLAFKGDVYQGLEAENFTEEEMKFAQDHLRILSGLYGVLRPLDLMQPYRLEMGTRLQKGRKKNLYEFWGNQITDLLNKDLEHQENKVILNLASKEYFKAVKPKELNGTITTVTFKENRNGKFKVISFNAKKARGAMARQIVLEGIDRTEDLKDLVVNGYTFNEGMSSKEELVFTC